jgi:hypothetical protein
MTERTCVTCKHWQFSGSDISCSEPAWSGCWKLHWNESLDEFEQTVSRGNVLRLKILTARECGDYQGVE